MPANPQLDPHSPALVGAFDSLVSAEQQTNTGPWINTTAYSVPVYTVPADQPTLSVTLASPRPAPSLQEAFSEVPLPPNAQPATGTDGTLVLWQPSTEKLWEFWRLAHRGDSWQASWGGAMQDVSSGSGAYEPASWPGASSYWGASASSLSVAGGLITLEDLQGGEINHALALGIPNVRAGVYASPAERTDGTSWSNLTLPEGAHLRLNPNLDLASLHLAPLTLMIAKAAQRYGIYVRDEAQDVTFYAQDPTPTASNPYSGPEGYFEGTYPNRLLASFPWSELQLMPMELNQSH